MLAGGESRRFGTDKSRAEWRGRTLVDHVADTLGSVTAEVVVVSARPDAGSAGHTVLPERLPGEGPLAGIEAALEHAATRALAGVLVVACDMPTLSAGRLGLLLDAFSGQAPVAAARDTRPGFEPLCAVYPTDCAGTATQLLAQGDRAAYLLFQAWPGHVVDIGPVTNVNTEAELTALAATDVEIGEGPR